MNPFLYLLLLIQYFVQSILPHLLSMRERKKKKWSLTRLGYFHTLRFPGDFKSQIKYFKYKLKQIQRAQQHHWIEQAFYYKTLLLHNVITISCEFSWIDSSVRQLRKELLTHIVIATAEMDSSLTNYVLSL